MGRRKIEMKMVNDSGSRQVTFSKRRNGLFKKANELATLCAAEIAIVVFSPGGKPFSFGHPGVEPVAERFLNQKKRTKFSTHGVTDSLREARVEKLNDQLNDLIRQLQAEKKKGEMINKTMKTNGKPIPKPLNELCVNELLKMKAALEKLQEKLNGRVTEMEASSSLLLLSKKPVAGCGNP